MKIPKSYYEEPEHKKVCDHCGYESCRCDDEDD